MEKDLKYFMREHKEEIVTVPGPVNDENGEPVMLEIKVLDNKRIQEINEHYRKRNIATDKKGNPLIAMGEVVFKTEKDGGRAVRHIIAEALVYPDLANKELMAFYNCYDITEMPFFVFPKADEFAHVQRAVFAALGLIEGADDEETIEAAKN
jgi:hypothetical protein